MGTCTWYSTKNAVIIHKSTNIVILNYSKPVNRDQLCDLRKIDL